MHHESPESRDLVGLHGPEHRILEQAAAEALAVIVSVKDERRSPGRRNGGLPRARSVVIDSRGPSPLPLWGRRTRAARPEPEGGRQRQERVRSEELRRPDEAPASKAPELHARRAPSGSGFARVRLPDKGGGGTSCVGYASRP